MTEKDKASPRQRLIMEERWAKARKECPAGTCAPSSRFHVSGCPRKQARVPRESLVVTNLNTGETSKATTVKDAMDANDKQAILLEPEPWSDFERGQNRELFEPRIHPAREYYDNHDSVTGERLETTPARPWWKRVFSRG